MSGTSSHDLQVSCVHALKANITRTVRKGSSLLHTHNLVALLAWLGRVASLAACCYKGETQKKEMRNKRGEKG